jgi:hypothetical protein
VFSLLGAVCFSSPSRARAGVILALVPVVSMSSRRHRLAITAVGGRVALLAVMPAPPTRTAVTAGVVSAFRVTRFAVAVLADIDARLGSCCRRRCLDVARRARRRTRWRAALR